jgi:hypothetical protein
MYLFELIVGHIERLLDAISNRRDAPALLPFDEARHADHPRELLKEVD